MLKRSTCRIRSTAQAIISAKVNIIEIVWPFEVGSAACNISWLGPVSKEPGVKQCLGGVRLDTLAIGADFLAVDENTPNVDMLFCMSASFSNIS